MSDGWVIRQEYLGGASLGEDHFDEQFERLFEKYQTMRPACVVTSGQTAFAFMCKYRDLFADVPVLFCGMERPGPARLRECGECAGVPLAVDVRGNVDLLFNMRPDTRTVVGIMDGSAESKRLRHRLEKAMEPYMGRAQLIFPGFEPGDDGGLTLKSLTSVASSVPGTGAVLFLGFSEDRNGKGLDEAEAVAALAARSVGPVLVLTDDWLGTGVLGGLVARGHAQGREVALLVERAQAGEAVREMLPQPPAPQPVFDGTALARFGIASVPPDAVVVNVPARPEAAGHVASSDFLLWAAALAALLCLLFGVRRFYKRSRM